MSRQTQLCRITLHKTRFVQILSTGFSSGLGALVSFSLLLLPSSWEHFTLQNLLHPLSHTHLSCVLYPGDLSTPGSYEYPFFCKVKFRKAC
jgi:hypothetical protein